ncbi:MAG TPA: DUF1461 domain-containing protein [Candidatus Caenarcaniphilales bacterium]|nr:DUF1461 domain-containing protein [Candidatus Caenarcaniphilales bacterium]
MSTARASATLRAGSRARGRSGVLQVLLPAATAITLLAGSLVVLLLPLYMHPALDAAGAPRAMGLTSTEVHALSDRTVTELILGPGTFAFLGPDGQLFYGSAEAEHLRDVRLVLYGFLLLGLASLTGLVVAVAKRPTDRATWKSIARGGAGLVVALAVAAAFALLAFGAAFELFHRLLFPGGNWSFDPATQRLVQLYPLTFWQITAAALGLLGSVGGLVVWALAGHRARRLAVPQ